MSRIAVVGAGIAGMAAAHYLSARHEVFLFEREARPGGHTRTVAVDGPEGDVPVDMGFIVFNERNYPNLTSLFRALGVESQPSDMSFSVSSRATGFEYSSRGASGYFADRANLLRPAHYGLLAEILRFHRTARRLLRDEAAGTCALDAWLDKEGFSRAFRRHYLYPMASAVWSTSLEEIPAFPAGLLARFFDNHGMLQVVGNPRWRVVRGGSSAYIAPLLAPLAERVVTGAAVEAVCRAEVGVTLRFANRPPMVFDEVVLACHGDQVLRLLEHPTAREQRVFSAFRTNRNETWLHTDASVLPRRLAARASWNYHLGEGERAVTLTYDMNRLQSLPGPRQYCVTLHPEGLVDPATVIAKASFNHPLYTLDALRAQEQWGSVSGADRLHYCGAYWFNGFHEDGVRSALRVAQAVPARESRLAEEAA